MGYEFTTDHHHAFWSGPDDQWLERHVAETEAEGWRVVSVSIDQSTTGKDTTPPDTYWVMTKA